MRKTLLATTVLVLAGTTSAWAQTATVNVAVDVAPVLAISASGAFSFPAASEATYTTGYLESTSGPTLSHRANVPYKVTMQAQSGSTLSFANYTGRTDVNPNKPIGDLRMLATFGGTAVNAPVGAASSPVDFYTRAARGNTQSGALTARLALDWANDPPGTYSTTVVFTIVAQ